MTTFTGTAGNDVLPLMGADNAGNDILYGLAGHDALYGGLGNDILYGDVGNDLLVGGFGVDTLYGGAGVDTASYSGAAGSVNVNLGSGLAYGADSGPAGEHLFDIENLTGSGYNDVLSGSSGDNRLMGGGGNDGLYGYAGNDTLTGEDGNDTLDGGADGDWLYGGAGADTLRGGSQSYLDGSDYLDGGAGDDVLNGGRGSDELVGGAGADRFVWEGDYYTVTLPDRDMVRDFSSGSDRIDLSGVDADFNTPGVQAFTWLGVDQPFTGHGGELTFSNGQIMADMDGITIGGGADLVIQLDGVATMSRSDFIL